MAIQHGKPSTAKSNRKETIQLKRKIVKKAKGGHQYINRRDYDGITGEDTFARRYETTDIIEVDSKELQRLVHNNPHYAKAAEHARREFGTADFSDPKFVSEVLVKGARRSNRRSPALGAGEYKATSGWALMFFLLLFLGMCFLLLGGSLGSIGGF